MNIVVGRNGKETVAKLAELTGSTVYSKHYSRRSEFWRKNFCKCVKGFVPTTSGITINWAINPSEISYSGIVYNQRGVCLASDKPRARMVLQQSGVSVPSTTTDKSLVRDWIAEGKTIVCRPNKHRGGSNFVVINSESSESDISRAINSTGYYAVFFPKTREFRAHCGHGKILVLQEKVPNRDGVDLHIPRPWNHATGEFVFRTVPFSEYPLLVCKNSVNAVKALGLDFGAVDIMEDGDGNVAVCEVNTSPSLADYSMSRYERYFKWLAKSQERREHFNSSEYTKGSSFAWKNCHFEDGTNEEDQ